MITFARCEALEPILNAKADDEILTYEEAYAFAMLNYNHGGDGFVECCDEREFDRLDYNLNGEEFRIWSNTKATLRKDFQVFNSIRNDMTGW